MNDIRKYGFRAVALPVATRYPCVYEPTPGARRGTTHQGRIERDRRMTLDLVARAKRGDSAAFESLYRQHVGRVYLLCLRMTGNPHHAEDLVQDTFVSAWQQLSSFHGRSAFGTWLHRLTVNKVLQYLRSGKARGTSSSLDASTYEKTIHTVTPETRIDIERAVARLPNGAREVLILHDIEGYRYREIAELLDIAEGTVKSQLSRARQLLREMLERCPITYPSRSSARTSTTS